MSKKIVIKIVTITDIKSKKIQKIPTSLTMKNAKKIISQFYCKILHFFKKIQQNTNLKGVTDDEKKPS
jgi:hypothetical protein